MVLDRNMLSVGIVVVAAYIFMVQPLSTAMASVGLSIAIYAITKSEGIVLAFLLATLFIKQFNSLFKVKNEPMGIEAFQTKDAPSIHTRLEEVRRIQPKVEPITGVLESPNILDNMPLQAMETLTKEGVPCASIPASAKARVLIYPKAEGFVPASNMSVERNLVANPTLMDGADVEAENSALASGIEELNPAEIGGAEFASAEPMRE
jgi:hypothetical protein